MQHVRCLFLITAHFEFIVKAAHIPVKQNIVADAISRNNLVLFHSQVPKANPQPTGIPHAVESVVIHRQPDWLSQNWSQLFSNCLWQGLPPQPEESTSPAHTDSNSIGMEAYPMSERSLLLFVAFLFTENLAPSTIKTYLVAVRYEQIGRGLGDPCMAQMPQLEYAIKGAKRLSKLKKRNCLPITPRILALLKNY